MYEFIGLTLIRNYEQCDGHLVRLQPGFEPEYAGFELLRKRR